VDDCEVKDRKVGQAVAGERLSQCDRVQLMLLSAAGLTAVSALLAQQLHHWQVCMRHQALEARVAKIASCNAHTQRLIMQLTPSLNTS